MTELSIAACVKWTDLRPDIDLLHGSVEPQSHGSGLSASDLAAVETALQLADSWTAAGTPTHVVAVCLGPVAADGALRDLLAAGVSRAVRLDGRAEPSEQPSSDVVAATLASVLADGDIDASLIVCGDVSADRGSGSVPAFLAHELGAAQALGLIGVVPGQPGTLAATRRLDGGRRERLAVSQPAVISVEGSVADLRRASLAATLAARNAVVETRPRRSDPQPDAARLRPWRPRPRVLAPPHGAHALDRIVQLTGAFVDRTPPRTVVLDPGDAADTILDQLRVWGYLGDDEAVDAPPAAAVAPTASPSQS